ncbi:MAG: thiol protease/hemagglutinin PrtT [Bacteroidales bacterium]|nr:thiol protease/hemagglutinin PrtT [Bacteroidales bacterium]
MKHVVYTILFAVLAVQVFSQEVDEKTARIVAERFFLKNYGHKASVENVIVKQYKGHESIYYCNLDRGGWVAVPANRNLNPVVAHSDEGSVDLNNAPQVFLDWMEQYEFVADVAMQEKWYKEDRHKKWDELLVDDFDELNVLKSYVNHSELLSSRWGQFGTNDVGCGEAGYNILMPESSCGSVCIHCAAGCLAVAVGQIMNYWGYATGGYANFDWWNMPDELSIYSQNLFDEQIAISYLFKRIGDKVDMDYCFDSKCQSSALPEDEGNAFEAFGYKDDMDYKKKKWHTYNSWVNILKTEILAERPVLYNYIGRHSFVCDGYDSSNDNFHFNFGWNGAYNYWIDFEDIDDIPGCDLCQNYTSLSNHTCLINIRPNVSSVINLTNKTISTPATQSYATNTTYQAKSYISVAGGSSYVNVMDSSSCRFIAGDSVLLKPGFHAQAGTSLLCKIFKRPALKEGDLTAPDDFSIITYSDDKNNENTFENEIANLFEVYPNPAKNEITISLKKSKEKDITLIQIYNSIGVQMFERTTDKLSITVDVSGFPIGQYIINVKNNSRIYCKSFIKN